jgi:hypothetical protein
MDIGLSLENEWKNWWIAQIADTPETREMLCNKMKNIHFRVEIFQFRGKNMNEFVEIPTKIKASMCNELLVDKRMDEYGMITFKIPCQQINSHYKYRICNNRINKIDVKIMLCNDCDNYHVFSYNYAFMICYETFYVDYHLRCILLVMMHEYYVENKCQELPSEHVLADCFLMKMMTQY